MHYQRSFEKNNVKLLKWSLITKENVKENDTLNLF